MKTIMQNMAVMYTQQLSFEMCIFSTEKHWKKNGTHLSRKSHISHVSFGWMGVKSPSIQLWGLWSDVGMVFVTQNESFNLGT